MGDVLILFLLILPSKISKSLGKKESDAFLCRLIKSVPDSRGFPFILDMNQVFFLSLLI